MKVEGVSEVGEVSCGVAHTLVLSRDGLTVWSFGSGDSGKLGHGDTTKQMAPKVFHLHYRPFPLLFAGYVTLLYHIC